MAKFGKKVQETVKSVMERMKSGKLRSGSGKKVTNRKQAVAIGLSEARENGAKVPAPKKSQSTKSTASKAQASKSKTQKAQRGPVSRKKTTATAKRRSTAKAKK